MNQIRSTFYIKIRVQIKKIVKFFGWKKFFGMEKNESVHSGSERARETIEYEDKKCKNMKSKK